MTRSMLSHLPPLAFVLAAAHAAHAVNVLSYGTYDRDSYFFNPPGTACS